MGQQEIYLFLRKHRNKWFSAKDIAEKTNISIESVRENIKRLRKSKLIKYNTFEKDINHVGIKKIYLYKFS